MLYGGAQHRGLACCSEDNLIREALLCMSLVTAHAFWAGDASSKQASTTQNT
jgi:hypothetical protein